jgi:hypothetical protein
MSTEFTVGDLADAVTRGKEGAMRKLLNTVAGDVFAPLDEYATNRAETVTRAAVVELYARRLGDHVGRALGQLLGQSYTPRARGE